MLIVCGVQPRAQLDIPGLLFRVHGGGPGVPGARFHHLPPRDRARAGQVCTVLHDRVRLHHGILHVLEGLAAAAVPHDVAGAPALQHRCDPAVLAPERIFNGSLCVSKVA
jgi:hypothetical protein